MSDDNDAMRAALAASLAAQPPFRPSPTREDMALERDVRTLLQTPDDQPVSPEDLEQARASQAHQRYQTANALGRMLGADVYDPDAKFVDWREHFTATREAKLEAKAHAESLQRRQQLDNKIQFLERQRDAVQRKMLNEEAGRIVASRKAKGKRTLNTRELVERAAKNLGFEMPQTDRAPKGGDSDE
jgi:hypothetical protein